MMILGMVNGPPVVHSFFTPETETMFNLLRPLMPILKQEEKYY
jgi:hypothetical protein